MTGTHEDQEVVVRSARTVYLSLLLPSKPEWEIWSNQDALRLLGNKDAPWTVYYQPTLDMVSMVPYKEEIGLYVEGPPPPQSLPEDNTTFYDITNPEQRRIRPCTTSRFQDT